MRISLNTNSNWDSHEEERDEVLIKPVAFEYVQLHM